MEPQDTYDLESQSPGGIRHLQQHQTVDFGVPTYEPTSCPQVECQSRDKTREVKYPDHSSVTLKEFPYLGQ